MSPHALRRFHAIATIAWLILLVPSVTIWRESLVWVVLMSAYACVMGHFSSWHGVRAEEKVDEQATEQRPVPFSPHDD